MKKLHEIYQTSYKVMNHPSIVYYLGSTTRNKLLNYKYIVNKIDIYDLETFGTGLRDCSCKGLPLINRDHGHIITGDLRFIENKDLRKLINKGASFQESRTINLNRCKDVIRKGKEDWRQRLSSSNNNIQENNMIT